MILEEAAVFFAEKGFTTLWYSYRGEVLSPMSQSFDYFVDNLATPGGQPIPPIRDSHPALEAFF